MPSYLATDVVTSLLERGLLPTGDDTFTTARLLSLMSDELRLYVVDVLREVDEEYLVATTTVSVVAGTASYRLPARSVANGVRRVALVRDGLDVPLVRLSPERHVEEGPGYYLRGARLVLSPTPTQADTLRVDYMLRPAQLVESSTCGRVFSLTTSGGLSGVVCAGTRPPGMAIDDSVDFVRGSPPFDVVATDAEIVSSGVVGGSYTLLFAPLPEGVEAGDWVCPADTSPVAQVPLELHALLAQRTTAVVLAALGSPKAQAAFAQADDMRRQAVGLLAPRDDGGVRYLVNPHSPARTGLLPLRRRYY